MNSEFPPKYFFNLQKFNWPDIFSGLTCAWQALGKLEEQVNKLFGQLKNEGEISKQVYFIEDGAVISGEGSIIEPGVRIKGKVIIGAGTRIMSGAFLIGPIIIGTGGSINGEVDHSIILNNNKSNHRGSYLGHSIIGNEVGIAANTVLSNRKVNRSEIMIKNGDEKIPTGFDFFSSVIGDRSRTACNTTIGPGTLVGQDCWILSSLGSNIVPSGYIAKVKRKLELIPRNDL